MSRMATVFGGTGFLGRRIVRRLLDQDWSVRVASRHPERFDPPLDACGNVERIGADVRDEASVAAALSGSEAAINAVSLYVERGGATFRSVHVDGARRLAALSQRHGVSRFVHVSGIGADAGSASPYIRCRGEGEIAVRRCLATSTILRPSVMYGAGDAFLRTLDSIVRRSPVLPLFGSGLTRLQPVFVDDVAEAIANALTEPAAIGRTFELGGAEVHTYRELVTMIARHTGRRRLLLPVPFAIWHCLAAASAVLPHPPVTEGQVALMRRDNVASPDLPGLPELGVTPTSLSEGVDLILGPLVAGSSSP